jgi:hypothetical protein
MQATARTLSVVSATSCARRRLIRDVRPTSSTSQPMPVRIHPSRLPSAPRLTLWTIVTLWLVLEVVYRLDRTPFGEWTGWDYAGIAFRGAVTYSVVFHMGLLQLLFGAIIALIPFIAAFRILEQIRSADSWMVFSTDFVALLVAPIVAYLLLASKTIRQYRSALEDFEVLPPPTRSESSDAQ